MPTMLGRRTLVGPRAVSFRRTLASTLVLLACSAPPTTIPEIRIVNGTPYDLDVEVNGGDRESWLPVAIVDAGETDVAHEVIDQGELWIFRVRHWGDPVGELRVTRQELERTGWTIEIPDSVEDRLRDLGRPEAPQGA